MSLSPEEIANKRFVVALRGYDKDEVHGFLKEVADATQDLLRQVGDEGASKEVADNPLSRFGAQIESIVAAAVEAAQRITAQAEEEANQLLATARQQAQERLDEVERAMAKERSEWDKARKEFLAAEAQRQRRAEEEVAQLKTAVTATLDAAKEARAAAEREMREARETLSSQMNIVEAKAADAAELQRAARRELDAATAVRRSAEHEAAAVMARAHAEAQQLWQHAVEQFKPEPTDAGTGAEDPTPGPREGGDAE